MVEIHSLGLLGKWLKYNKNDIYLFINVKNFRGSLTTVVRAGNNTSKTANIIDTIFDRTLDFQINLDPGVRRISVPKLWIHSSASFISTSLVQIDC